MHPKYTAATIERFWSKVDRTADCWHRDGPSNGVYSAFVCSPVRTSGHRFALELALGRLLNPGEWALHDCPNGDDPLCVRNDTPGWKEVSGILYPKHGHLWAGTHAANMQDMIGKGRSLVGVNRIPDEHLQRGNAHWTHRMPERVARGEGKSRSKLTMATVNAIFTDRANGMIAREIGAKYGVHIRTVFGILSGERWAHARTLWQANEITAAATVSRSSVVNHHPTGTDS